MCPDPSAQAAADRELIDQLEQLASLLREENPDLAAIIGGAVARLRELTQ